jgi:hypothetical protein
MIRLKGLVQSAAVEDIENGDVNDEIFVFELFSSF